MTEKIELTSQIYWAIEEWEILDIRWDKKSFFESFDDWMDWVFPRVNEWTKFANKIDKEWIEWWVKRNVKYYWFSKVEETSDCNTFELTLKDPIKVCMWNVWERLIVEEAKKIRVEFTYEWYFTKNWRQDKIANWIEILCRFKDILS